MKYIALFDLDGSTILLRPISITRETTHLRVKAKITMYYPAPKLPRGVLLGYVTVIFPPGFEDYIFMKIKVLFNEVVVVSGTLVEHKGYLVFKPALPFNVFIQKLSSNEKETYYRDLYLKSVAMIGELRSELVKDLEALNRALFEGSKSYTEIIANIYRQMERALSFLAKPEVLGTIENALIALSAPPPATPSPTPAPPPTPAKRSLLDRLRGLIRWIRGK